MSKLRVQEIREFAKRIIAQTPGGVRYSELIAKIASEHPETPTNTIQGSVWDLDKTYSGQIVKPSRGLFVFDGKALISAEEPDVASVAIREADFYESFADWLKNDLDEATEAIALGGSELRSKWGTPDVVGTFKPLPSNRIKFDLEIISAELKVSTSQSIEALVRRQPIASFRTRHISSCRLISRRRIRAGLRLLQCCSALDSCSSIRMSTILSIVYVFEPSGSRQTCSM